MSLAGVAQTIFGYFTDADNAPVNPTTPLVDIIRDNPNPATLVTDAVPTPHALGTLKYVYTWPGAGTYRAHWTGVVDGQAVAADETFTVGPAPGAAGGTGPCQPWVEAGDLSADCGTDAATLEWAAAQASSVLYVFSGRLFPGVCAGFVSRPMYAPVPGAGHCCGYLPQVRLGPEPIVDVAEVLVDGAVVPPHEYRVDHGIYLVRLPGPGNVNRGWPCCQLLTLPATERGTMQVTYAFGRAVPPTGVAMANVLACELAKARKPDECRLPRRTTQVVRQQVTYTVLDPMSLFAKGQTGIPEVDLWLGSVNPGKLQQRPRVYSPDLPTQRHIGP